MFLILSIMLKVTIKTMFKAKFFWKLGRVKYLSKDLNEMLSISGLICGDKAARTCKTIKNLTNDWFSDDRKPGFCLLNQCSTHNWIFVKAPSSQSQYFYAALFYSANFYSLDPSSSWGEKQRRKTENWNLTTPGSKALLSCFAKMAAQLNHLHIIRKGICSKR